MFFLNTFLSLYYLEEKMLSNEQNKNVKHRKWACNKLCLLVFD